MSSITIAQIRDQLKQKYDFSELILDDICSLFDDYIEDNFVEMDAVDGPTESAPRHKTGYNLYLASRFREAKEAKDKRNSQELMTAFSAEWTKLSFNEQKPFYDEAAAQNKSCGNL